MLQMELPGVFFNMNDLLLPAIVPGLVEKNRQAGQQQPSQQKQQSQSAHCRRSEKPLMANFNANKRQAHCDGGLNTTNIHPLLAAFEKPNPLDFKFNLNLADFAPNEVSVKLDSDGRTVVVHAKHEARSTNGDHCEKREYMHKCVLPDNVLVDRLRCKLSQFTGELVVTAPTKPKVGQSDHDGQYIPIEVVASKHEKVAEEKGAHPPVEQHATPVRMDQSSSTNEEQHKDEVKIEDVDLDNCD